MRGIELLRSAGSNNAPTPVQKVRIYLKYTQPEDFDTGENCQHYSCFERISLQEPTFQLLTPSFDEEKNSCYVEIDDGHYLMLKYYWDDVECPLCETNDFVYCHLDIYDAEDNVIIIDEISEWNHETDSPEYTQRWGIEDNNSSIWWRFECSESDCEGRGKYDENYSGVPCSSVTDECGRSYYDPDYGQPCSEETDECGRTPDDPHYGHPCDEDETDDCGRTPDDPEYGQPCEEYDPCENLDECGRCEDDPDYGTPCDEEEEPEEEPEE